MKTHVEEIISSHSGFTGNSSGDDDNLGILETSLESVVFGRESNALADRECISLEYECARAGPLTHDGGRVDVGDVGSDSGTTSNIVEGELSDERVLLEEQRQRLSDSTFVQSSVSVEFQFQEEMEGKR